MVVQVALPASCVNDGTYLVVGCMQGVGVQPVYAGSSVAINCRACPAGLSGSMGQWVGYTWGATVRASPGGAPLGVSRRVDRVPAERGRGTRAFNSTRLFSVDAVPKRTRA